LSPLQMTIQIAELNISPPFSLFPQCPSQVLFSRLNHRSPQRSRNPLHSMPPSFPPFSHRLVQFSRDVFLVASKAISLYYSFLLAARPSLYVCSAFAARGSHCPCHHRVLSKILFPLRPLSISKSPPDWTKFLSPSQTAKCNPSP